MYGIRSAEQKSATREIEKETEIPKPKTSIKALCSFETGKTPSLSLTRGDFCATVTRNEEISCAQNQPANFESVAKNLIKLGDTFFSLEKDDISMTLSPDSFVPASAVNEMRREASQKLYEEMTKEVSVKRARLGFRTLRAAEKETSFSVRLYFRTADNFEEKTQKYDNVESVVFPLDYITENCEKIKEISKRYTVVILFPRVLFEGEKESAKDALIKAKNCGAQFCEISNIGHLDVVKEASLEVYGGIGLNITNSLCAEFPNILGIRFNLYILPVATCLCTANLKHMV